MVKELVVKNIKTKLNVVVKITLINLSKLDDDGDPITKPHHLDHRAKDIPQENWFERSYEDLWETLFSKYAKITAKESGWSLLSIDYTDVILSNYEQAGGHGFQPLPKWVANRGGIINPRSKDGSCFMDAFTIAANLDYLEGRRNRGRITQEVNDMRCEFDFSRVSDNPGLKGWNIVVKDNPSVNLKIYYRDPHRQKFITGCFKTPVMKEGERPRLVELFWNNRGEGHYSAISDKSALLSKQMSGVQRRKCYFCDRCDNVFKRKRKRDDHQRNYFGLRTRKYKDINSITRKPYKMKFRNIRGLTRAPFACYADSESNFKPEYIRKGNTKLIQKHNASCWGFHYIGPHKTKYYDFFPPNPTENLVKGLVKEQRKYSKNILSQ